MDISVTLVLISKQEKTYVLMLKYNDCYYLPSLPLIETNPYTNSMQLASYILWTNTRLTSMMYGVGYIPLIQKRIIEFSHKIIIPYLACVPSCVKLMEQFAEWVPIENICNLGDETEKVIRSVLVEG